MRETHFSVGSGRAVITPPLGTMLAGYGFRDHGAEGILDDLEARVFWIDAPGDHHEPLCIVCADLIGFGEQLTAQVREDLHKETGVRPNAVLLAASHTHSGPQTCENVIGAGDPPGPEYMESLRQKIVDAAREAKRGSQPALLRAGRGLLEEGYAINRRRRVKGETINAPNPHGVRDDEVTTLSFHSPQSGNVLAVLFHFTCHSTILGDYVVSGDYPGAARRYIESHFSGAAAGFLPGCFGDVRPNCTVVGGKRFRRGRPEDVATFGTALGEKVVESVDSARASFAPAPAARTDSIELPFAEAEGTATLSLQRLDLASDVTLIAMGGELCVDYGYFIKWLRPGSYTIPLGYSNGMVAYVPSARLFPEGGYETHTSGRYFGLPSPFHPSIEGIIHGKVREIMA